MDHRCSGHVCTQPHSTPRHSRASRILSTPSRTPSSPPPVHTSRSPCIQQVLHAPEPHSPPGRVRARPGFELPSEREDWRRKWQPTPVLLPGESQGWRSLVGCHLWGHTVGHKRSDLAAAEREGWGQAGPCWVSPVNLPEAAQPLWPSLQCTGGASTVGRWPQEPQS